MTQDEAITELRRLQKDQDTEIAHVEADEVLCAVLKSLGCVEIVNEYEKIEEWYA